MGSSWSRPARRPEEEVRVRTSEEATDLQASRLRAHRCSYVVVAYSLAASQTEGDETRIGNEAVIGCRLQGKTHEEVGNVWSIRRI